jgi:DNA-binding CsgD family transcriptional regulator
VIIQPATPNEVAPLVALAYGLTSREAQITRLCLQGRSTKEMAAILHVSPYTIQDHLKSIFDKTGVRSRNELVGQIFLEHYVTRWPWVVIVSVVSPLSVVVSRRRTKCRKGRAEVRLPVIPSPTVGSGAWSGDATVIG